MWENEISPGSVHLGIDTDGPRCQIISNHPSVMLRVCWTEGITPLCWAPNGSAGNNGENGNYKCYPVNRDTAALEFLQIT